MKIIHYARLGKIEQTQKSKKEEMRKLEEQQKETRELIIKVWEKRK